MAFLGRTALDFTRFWRELSRVDTGAPAPNLTGWDNHPDSLAWWQSYVNLRRSASAAQDALATEQHMLAHNPKFVARNYLLQQVIDEKDPVAQAPSRKRIRPRVLPSRSPRGLITSEKL